MAVQGLLVVMEMFSTLTVSVSISCCDILLEFHKMFSLEETGISLLFLTTSCESAILKKKKINLNK